jgi:hypothetical protein
MYNRYIGNTGKYYKVDDAPPAPGRGTLQSMLGALLPEGLYLDIGDIILLLLLVLLYIDSGDDEFLVILGFMVFAMFKKRSA